MDLIYADIEEYVITHESDEEEEQSWIYLKTAGMNLHQNTVKKRQNMDKELIFSTYIWNLSVQVT